MPLNCENIAAIGDIRRMFWKRWYGLPWLTKFINLCLLRDDATATGDKVNGRYQDQRNLAS